MDIIATASQWSTTTLIAQDAGSSGFLGDQSSTAQTGSQPIGTAANQTTGNQGMGSLFPILIFMMAGLLIMTSLSGRKERKKHANLIDNLAKKDKIRVAGGIIGTIIELKNDELLIETDRASNTRIRVARSSVQRVISSKSTPVQEESAEQSELAESK